MNAQQKLDAAIDELERKLRAPLCDGEILQVFDTLRDALSHHKNGVYDAAFAVVAASREEREERNPTHEARMKKWAQSPHILHDAVRQRARDREKGETHGNKN